MDLTCEKKNENLSLFEKSHDAKDSLSFSTSQSGMDCTKSRGLIAKTIFCGQILSILLCSIGTASTSLATWFNVHTPLFQAFFTYFLLALTFGSLLASKKSTFHEALRKRGWKYFIVAVIDVNANFMLIKSYSFTTMTSAQLCDSFTIPTVMMLSFAFLRVRYKLIHYTGVALCIVGSLVLVLTDQKDASNAENELAGDLLAFAGAFLYGCSNVCQEFFVKEFSHIEFLGMLGLFGSIVSGIQTVILERTVVSAITWNWDVVGLYTLFAISQYWWYALMPYVMKLSSAAVVNLSLLTADIFTLLVGLLVFQYKFSYIYFIAFVCILLGLVIYNLRPTPVGEKKKKKKNNNKTKFAKTKTANGIKDVNDKLLLGTEQEFRYHSFPCSQSSCENGRVTHTVAF